MMRVERPNLNRTQGRDCAPAIVRRPIGGVSSRRETKEMVPQGRVELPTSSLPMMRSTPELLRPSQRPIHERHCLNKPAHITCLSRLEKGVGAFNFSWHSLAMDKKPKQPASNEKTTREQRLAKALRDNLRRRKASNKKST